jgi:phosphatidylglycerophosphate synthase
MYKFKNKNKNYINIITFFIILLIFLILFITFKNYKKKNIIQENYLTYFLPYYNSNLDNLSNFYLKNDNNKNYI